MQYNKTPSCVYIKNIRQRQTRWNSGNVVGETIYSGSESHLLGGRREEGRKEGKVRSKLATAARAGNFVTYFAGIRSQKECLR